MKAQSNKRIHMLADGPIGKSLFTLAAPAIAGMVVIAVYNVVDTFFVSLMRDTTAVAATGIVFPVFQLIAAVGLTFGMGASSVISRRLGAGREEDALQTAATAFYTALGVGILFSITGMVLTEPILTAFGATDSILAQATLYGRIILGGSVFQVLNMTMNNLLRSEGAAIHSSMGQILGAVLNMILDPVFIFALDMGITGAAVATVISQGIATLFLFSFYLRDKGVLRPQDIKNFRLNWYIYSGIMSLGLPTLVRQVLGSVSFGLLNHAAGEYGDSAIAALSVTMRLFMLLLMTLFGLAQGLQPLAGYNFGAENFDRVRKANRIAFLTSAGICAVAGVTAFILSRSIMNIFAPQDIEVVKLGSAALRMSAAVLVPVGFVVMFGAVFQALGKGTYALTLAVGQQGAFLIPLVVLLPRYLGVYGVFLAPPGAFVLAFFIGLILIYRVYSKILPKGS